MFVSVIIPTFNEEAYLGNLLACLQCQTFQNMEIIVADAGSRDATRDIAAMYRAMLARGGRVAVGRNNGALVAHGDILVFLDADVTFGPLFFERCLGSFTRAKADIACCFFSLKDMNSGVATMYRIWNKSKKLRIHSAFPDGEGQCLWIRKSVFLKLKGFNKRLRIGEDVDLIHRASQAGFRYTILPHTFRPSSRRYKEMGTVRVIAATLLSGIGQILGIKQGNHFSEKLYGGWGKYNRR